MPKKQTPTGCLLLLFPGKRFGKYLCALLLENSNTHINLFAASAVSTNIKLSLMVSKTAHI